MKIINKQYQGGFTYTGIAIGVGVVAVIVFVLWYSGAIDKGTELVNDVMEKITTAGENPDENDGVHNQDNDEYCNQPGVNC
ncbi:MAG: hypothetical protein ACI9XC_001087 [Gammaproteobacteria bacterium]|jgi:hypothetical protein